jgi:enolase
MVEAVVRCADGSVGRGGAPTGTSVGMHEAFVLRDGDPGAYAGLSVYKAIKNIDEIIAPALIGMPIDDQRSIDKRMTELDGTENKSRLGGNAIYSVSIACLRAAACHSGVPVYAYLAGGSAITLPIPGYNMINGGRYDALTQPFNEFIMMPWRARSTVEAVEMGVLIFDELGRVLARRLGHKPHTAGSYGYAAPSADPAEVLGLMRQAAENCGYKGRVAFALDCASSEMYDADTGTYLLYDRRVSADELIDCARRLSDAFDLAFIEDLLDENDWDAWGRAAGKLKRTLLLGDDLIVSNRARLEKAHAMRAVDGFILKPNQVGTITEALDTYGYAVDNGLLAVTSGRSGGVVDDIVMDLAVGLRVGFIKNGAPRSGERIEKLNFLLRAQDDNPGCRLADISATVRFL